MHIKNGFVGNDFSKYIAGVLIVIIAVVIGNIPMVFPMALKAAREGVPIPTDTEGLLKFLDPNTTFFFILLPFVFGMAALWLVVRYLHKQSMTSLTTGRAKIDWGRILFAFTLWGVLTGATIAISYYSEPELYRLNFDPVAFSILFVISVLMVPIQTSAEEYMFRGYLMQGLAVLAKNRWVPLLSTSVIFGLMHLSNPEVGKMGNILMVYYIGTGLFLGIVTLMDDGLELALGFHAANNLIGALLITADWTAFQTPSILKDLSEPTAFSDIILPVVIVFPIVLFIFSKKYGWSGWKEKLTGRLHNQPE